MTQTQFTQFYLEHLNSLKNFARSLTRDEVSSKDLVQESMIRAYKGKHTFKSGSNFRNWAFTIIKNTFITNFNKRKKRRVVNAPIDDFVFALENKHSIDNNALSKMRIKEIKKCIKKLSPKSQKPFCMHVEGYQYDEISDQLEIPIGTVKSRINFARTKLKSMLARKEMVAA